ncbi:MAG: hypothetical protein ACKODH_17215 [Limisphaerales bacterium]
MFWIAVVVGTLAALFGTAGIYDASHSSASGEWSGLGVLAMFVVDVPAGLILAGTAFTQRLPRRRGGLVLFGVVLVALPFLGAYALQQHRVQQHRESEERIQRRTREVLEEKQK